MYTFFHTNATGNTHHPSRKRRGAAAVEMALVFPLLMMLVFGVLDFGSMFFVRQTMVNAAREGARELAIQGASLSQAIAITQNRLDISGIDNTTITGQNAFKGNGDDATARQVYIQVEIPTNSALIGGDYLKLFAVNSKMTVNVTMRKEGELLAVQ